MRFAKAAITVRSIIQNIKDEILMIRCSPEEAHKVGLWELPGGHVDFGEDPNLGIIRETFEETGIKIRHPQIVNITSRINRRGDQILCLAYRVDAKEPIVKLSSEHTEYRWLTPQNAVKLPTTKRTHLILSEFYKDFIENE